MSAGAAKSSICSSVSASALSSGAPHPAALSASPKRSIEKQCFSMGRASTPAHAETQSALPPVFYSADASNTRIASRTRAVCSQWAIPRDGAMTSSKASELSATSRGTAPKSE